MYTQPISFHASNTPDRIAVEFGNRKITYKEFNDNINKVAHTLEDKIPDGNIVSTKHNDSYSEWLFILALSRLGYCTISTTSQEIITSIGNDFSCIISDHEGLNNIKNDRIIYISEIETKNIQKIVIKNTIYNRNDIKSYARISFSSGSTGISKRVLMNNSVILSRIKTGIFGLTMRNDRNVYCSLPKGTFGGFGVPVRTWYMGGTVVLTKPSLVELPRDKHLTIVTTPADLHALIKELPSDHIPFDNLSVIVGGSTLSPEAIRHTKARLTRNISLTYGSTETSTVAVMDIGETEHPSGLAGFVLPWVEVQIVDDDDLPLPIGSSGRVRIKCDGMVSSYLEDPEATKTAFRHGWFYPGDRGFLDEHRGLYILGRSDSTININGQKISAERIEAFLSSLPGVLDAAATTAAVTFGSLTAVLLVVKGTGFSEKRTREAVEKEFKLRNFSLQSTRKVPRNALGKIERHKLSHLIDPLRLPSAKKPPHSRLRRR